MYKSLEVLANITVPVPGETGQRSVPSTSLSSLAGPVWQSNQDESCAGESTSGPQFPMTETNVSFAFDILEPARRLKMSRNREMFAALITLHSQNPALLADLSKVITYMCRLQPPEFVYVSFAVELDRYLSRKLSQSKPAFAQDLKFVSSYVQNLSHVLLTKPEAKEMRNALRDCVCSHSTPVMSERDRQRSRLFHILLHSFSHNLAATVSLCFWAGAYRTTHLVLNCIDPLDINLMFLLEIDRFIELLERPLFRYVNKHGGCKCCIFAVAAVVLVVSNVCLCWQPLARPNVGRRQGSAARGEWVDALQVPEVALTFAPPEYLLFHSARQACECVALSTNHRPCGGRLAHGEWAPRQPTPPSESCTAGCRYHHHHQWLRHRHER